MFIRVIRFEDDKVEELRQLSIRLGLIRSQSRSVPIVSQPFSRFKSDKSNRPGHRVDVSWMCVISRLTRLVRAQRRYTEAPPDHYREYGKFGNMMGTM